MLLVSVIQHVLKIQHLFFLILTMDLIGWGHYIIFIPKIYI